MPEYNKYHHFTESDFLTDEFFQSWIFSPDEGANLFWNKFISDNPGKKNDISRAKMILESFRFKEDFPSEEKVREYLDKALATIDSEEDQKPKAIVRTLNNRWWAAAASLILLLTVGYFFFKKQPEQQIAKISPTSPIIKDIAPGGNKATLTLGNGQTIVLDSAGNGMLSTQGSSTVNKLADGQIAYEGSSNPATKEIVYNTISTPRGGQYNLTLSDGSKVWLNAESSLRFPASFSGDERSVELTGEGYFEVAHNSKKPFYVQVNSMRVEVLGTHFNVSAYNDESTIKTTLLEGSVKVSVNKQDVLLKPGQQVLLSLSNDKLQIENKVDIDQVIAWKNNEFIFNETELKDAMKQLNRWYNFEVQYEGNLDPIYLYGNISRDKGLAEVLKIMESSGLKFQMEKTGAVNKLKILKQKYKPK